MYGITRFFEPVGGTPAGIIDMRIKRINGDNMNLADYFACAAFETFILLVVWVGNNGSITNIRWEDYKRPYQAGNNIFLLGELLKFFVKSIGLKDCCLMDCSIRQCAGVLQDPICGIILSESCADCEEENKKCIYKKTHQSEVALETQQRNRLTCSEKGISLEIRPHRS